MNRKELIEHYESALYNLEHNLKNEQNPHNQSRYKSEINVVKSTMEALCGPRPNMPTGLVPCGCGGSAMLCLSFGSHDDTTGSKSFELNAECHECHASTSVYQGVIEDGESIKAHESMVVSDWNKAMGYKEETK